MRRRWDDLWTETFLGLSDNYYLIDTTTILPEAPLKASGHVDHFSDLLVTCTHCGESYRGDQLLEAATHEEHEGLTPAELDARIRELKIRCPNCKGELGIRRSEEHTSELQSPCNLVCRLLLEKKKTIVPRSIPTALYAKMPSWC